MPFILIVKRRTTTLAAPPLRPNRAAYASPSAKLLHPHQDAVQRLAEVPGLGWTRRNRSLLKLDSLQRPFLRGNSSPRGWAPAPATKRAQA